MEAVRMAKLASLEAVLDRIHDGSVIMIGGFMAVGTPENIIDGLVRKGVRNLTVIGNDTGLVDRGIGKLVVNKQVRKVIASHIGMNPETGRQMVAGEIEVELVPQGTLAERIRAGGAGLGGILTPTGVGTVVADGKRIIEANGREYLLELPLCAEVSLLKAHKADAEGNLVYRCAARNFNPLMATAAAYVAVETEHYLPAGEIDPDLAMTPGVLVDAVVVAN